MADFQEAIQPVMRNAQHSKQRDYGLTWVTTYQGLSRLDAVLRADIIHDQRRQGGRHNDAVHGTGANAILRVLTERAGDGPIESGSFDARHDAPFCVCEERWVHAGNVTCANYNELV